MDAFQKSTAPAGQSHLRSMLIAEDDERLLQCLARAMEARGFQVMTAASVFAALAKIQLNAPEYAVIDMPFSTRRKYLTSLWGHSTYSTKRRLEDRKSVV